MPGLCCLHKTHRQLLSTIDLCALLGVQKKIIHLSETSLELNNSGESVNYAHTLVSKNYEIILC